MAQKRIQGKGRVEKCGKESYRIRFSLGRDSITGKYKYSPWRPVHGSKSDVYRALEEYRREIESGLRFDLQDITFSQYADSFQAGRANSGALAQGTLDDDLYLFNILYRYLGETRIVDIDSVMLNDIISRMKKEDNIGDTRRHKLVVKIKRIMKEAVLDGIIGRDPTLRIKTPRVAKPNRKSLKDFQAAELLRILNSYPINRNSVAVHIGLGTGMRKGEVLALTWHDIDFYDHVIIVGYSIDRWKNRKTPKTDAGYRRISIDEHLLSILKMWKNLQAELLLKEGIGLNEDTPVCSDKVGGFCNSARFYEWFKNFCVDNDFARFVDDDGNVLPKRRFNENGQPIDENGRFYSRSNKKIKVKKHYAGLKFHELRHTQATLLIANGVDVKTVQERMGHARASTTLDFYAHADEERDRQAADLFSNLLNSKRDEHKVVNFG
jgi:integrase